MIKILLAKFRLKIFIINAILIYILNLYLIFQTIYNNLVYKMSVDPLAFVSASALALFGGLTIDKVLRKYKNTNVEIINSNVSIITSDGKKCAILPNKK